MDFLLDVDDVEPGMKLARSVAVNDRLLLPSGRTLSSRDLRRLEEWDVESVHVKPPPAESHAKRRSG